MRRSNDALARSRMRRQRLWGAGFKTPEQVVGWLGALQAQEFAVARWSIGQRTSGVGDEAIARAFDEGVFLRTHLLRPTWHFVLPADIRWMLEATAPRVHAFNAHYYGQLELDAKLFAKSNGVIERALAGGRHLTRKELAAALEQKGINASGIRLGYLMMRAELDGVICSGARRGKQHTYALLDERAPKARPLGSDDAVAELARRFFTCRGPATLKDLARWSSLTAAQARSGLEAVASELENETIDGRTYWFAAGGRATATKVSGRIDLVQGYDEIVMSYSESKDVLLGSFQHATIPARPPYLHALILDGRLIGHWRTVVGSDPPIVETSVYRPLNEGEDRALDAAIDRYARFLGKPVARG